MSWVINGCTSPMVARAIRKLHAARPDDHLVLIMRKPSSSIKPDFLPPTSDKIQYVQCDLDNLDSVRAAVESIAKRIKSGDLPRILGLCTAAAIQITDGPRMHKAGEETCVVNQLANSLIIFGLLEDSMNLEKGKIIVIGSDTHRDGYKYFPKPTQYVPLPELLHPPEGTKDGEQGLAEGRFRYGVTKLYQTATAHELARRLKKSKRYSKLRVVISEPGSMGGGLLRDRPWLERTLMTFALGQSWLMNWLDPGINASTPAKSGDTLARVFLEDSFADARPLNETGAPYYGPDGTQKATEGSANDTKKCEAIWNDTLKELNIGGEVAAL